jgi:L-fuconolactonase
MNEAGVGKAAVVHSSTTYGFDNSYVVDGCAKYPERLAAVGSVDVLQPDAPERIREWAARGLAGLRLFTGGSTKEFDPSELDDPRSFPAWELCGELGIPMCIQTGPVGLPQVTALARRFPNVNIILDHLGRPDVLDGAPYANAQSLWDLAAAAERLYQADAAHLRRREEGPGQRRDLLRQGGGNLRRPAPGLGFELPDLAGTLAEILATAQAGLASLSEEDREWIFSKTAQKLYPTLAVKPKSRANGKKRRDIMETSIQKRPAAANPWGILALLAIALLISFIDRTSLSSALADKGFVKEFGLTSLERGWLNAAFFWTYGLFQLVMGWVVDRYGVKWPYAICFGLWCVATALTGLVTTLTALIVMRLLIGAAEAIVIPASYRWMGNNFAESQKGLAVGLFTMGGKFGPAIGAPIAAWMIVNHSWQLMFVATGLVGLLWLGPGC